MIVDDEVNILEGIASIVDWKKYNSIVSGKAYHGEMAFESIMLNQPNIVITDIKMPGLNGVELIEKVHKYYPEIKFIILSGHDDFEFAKTAMQYGVKHYLLKPSSRKKIENALEKVIIELEEEKEKEHFIESIKRDFKRVAPIARKQFLLELMMNKSYGEREWNYYHQLFDSQPIKKEVRLIVMVIDGPHEFKHLFALKEIMLEVGREDMAIHLLTTIGGKIAILLEDLSIEFLLTKLKTVKKLFSEYYHSEFTTTISNSANIKQVQELYKEANDCLTQRFYLGNGSIITMSDLHRYKTNFENVQFDHKDITFSLKSGNKEQLQQHIDDFFRKIEQNRFKVSVVKSHCIELLMSIIREANRGEIDTFFEKITRFHEFKTLAQIKKFIEEIAYQIVLQNYEETRQVQHDIIQRVIQYIEEKISDESLSLGHIAEDVIYMNPDYLGRLFKKEVGETFSAFLIKLRIEKAIELIEESNTVKIYMIADQVGFGNNPRYFGQVFKRHTGVTPTEYKTGTGSR